MAGIALKIEDLDRAKWCLHGAEGIFVDGRDFGAAEDNLYSLYFVTKWTQELAGDLCDIDYELLLFENDPDSLMLKAKMEESQQVRDYITANYSAEEFKSMQEYILSPEFRKACFEYSGSK